jgi:DNA-binding NarL/FixJ family response regulator
MIGVLRFGLRMRLEAEPGIAVVGEAGTAEERWSWWSAPRPTSRWWTSTCPPSTGWS